MDCHEYTVMSRFPLLSASEDLNKWTGFISTASGKTVLLSLSVPEFPSAKGIQLITDELDEKTAGFWAPFLEQISSVECDTFLTFLELLKAQIREGTDSAGDEEAAEGDSDVYSLIIEEIEAIGIKNVASLSPDFREAIIKHEDKSGREHLLKLLIPESYPRKKPTVFAELPFPNESIVWPGEIKEIHKLFLILVETSCPFWNDMEELDGYVRVLDPIQPNKSHFHRKILLEENVIMHLVFNAKTPRGLPQISFAGPEKHVEAYNAAMDKECNVWDETVRVLQNLKSILDCEFVLKESGYDNDNNVEDQEPCLICYVYSFEEELPEISCDCGAVFHRQCIQDLYVTDVSTKSVAMLRRCVECPSCQMEITVPAGQAIVRTSW